MDNKVQELADKIYREGVQKATSEADAILKNAKAQSDKMVAEAKEAAERIVREAQQQAQEVKENAEAELKLSTNQAIESLRTQVTDMINSRAVAAAVDKSFADPSVLYSVVQTLAEQWSREQAVVIRTEDADKLEAYLRQEAKLAMDSNVRIEQVNGHAHTFEIAPQNGAYKVVVGKEAFVEYFKEFMRPKLRSFLFESSDRQ